MASEVFIDTSGFYALLVRDDDRHDEAVDLMRSADEKRRRFVTTDYVVDESATLLAARGLAGVIPRFFETVFASSALKLIWVDSERFERSQALFLRNLGRGWSFTDCVSFAVMKELRLREALTKDAHFVDAGFLALLAGS